ncbi:MAG: flagellar biosynthesis anti-sigma factor FlgM [Coriobacteriia bacterium]|nr:flagellar biosynthesis anti-sigma factor FlgM [Coriobacteriia bacterium]
MIISDEQVRRAVEYLQTAQCGNTTRIGCAETTGLSPEFMKELHRRLMALPDAREDRVAQARALIESPAVASEIVAEKMIGRIVSDALR